MKRKICIILISLLSTFANVQATDIEINKANFPDEGFQSYLRDEYGERIESSSNYNPIYVIRNMERISEMFIPSSHLDNYSLRPIEIRSIEGIEFFTELKKLNCYAKLSRLDVSKNTTLEHLECGGGYFISLDASECTALKYLYIAYAEDPLSSLDISGCTALDTLIVRNFQSHSFDLSKSHAKYVEITSGSFTSLNFSNNTALENLYIHHQFSLTSLDISGCTALTTLELSIVDELPSIDLTSCTSLDNLYLSNNLALKVPDLSKNINLTRIAWNNRWGDRPLDVSKNTKLEHLDISNAGMTVLDLSSNTELRFLNCWGNRLTSLNLSNNTKLTTLFVGNGMYHDERTLSSLDLSNNILLDSLWCWYTTLTSLDLSKNTALKYLNCHDNPLSSLDLSHQTKLEFKVIGPQKIETKAVKLDDGRIGIDIDAGNLDWLRVKELKGDGENMKADVSGNYLVIAENTENIPSNVTYRYDTKYPIETAMMEVEIAVDLSDFPSGILLTEEYFPDANFRDALALKLGVEEGDELSKENLRSTSLNVSGKSIRDLSGIEYFTALTELWCHNNQLTSLDVSKNTALTGLNCSDNQLTSLDMSKNTALKWLYCYGNQIKGEAMQTLAASLPTVTEGYFYVIDTKNENEGNVCTKSQVTVAKEKGWTVYDMNGSYWQEYEGSDDVLLLDDDNFPDDNFRNAIAKELGLSVGSEINEGLIVATIKLDVSDGKITELSGIDYFTALTTLYCQINQISDKAMTSLIGALPDLSGNEAKGLMLTEETNPRKGALYALDLTNENEQNVCTAEHVAAANAKGWTVYCKTSGGWQEYNGEIPTGINTVDSGELTDDSWYTIDGKKLAGEPKEKGIYIRNGRKVVKWWS